MCDEVCKICGGDDYIAKIARAMGHRPDIAFVRIKRLENVLTEIMKECQDDENLGYHKFVIEKCTSILDI